MNNKIRLLILMWIWLLLMFVFVFVDYSTNDQFLVEWAFVFGGFLATWIALIMVKD